MTPVHVANVRGWPGLTGWNPPRVPNSHPERLRDRPALVLATAAEAGVPSERFGLGAYLEVRFGGIFDGGIIVPDDLGEEALADIRAWCAHNPLDTAVGPHPWEVHRLSEFYDHRHGRFVTVTYTGRGWCVGVDLGRVFGLAAEHVSRRAEPDIDTWNLWLPGWGRMHDRGRVKRVSPHRPCLRVSARRVGWRVEFGPVEKDRGIWDGGRYRRGVFLDLLSAAYVLDADRGASYGEHRVNFGLSPTDLSLTVSLDEDGLTSITRSALSAHEFALVLDDHASRWFPRG